MRWRGPGGVCDEAVFGAFDGLTAFEGVLLGLLGHPALVFTAAVGVGVADTVGMAAGEWLSDSDNGPVAAAVIGAFAGVAAIAPALPYALGFPGWWARGWAAGLICAVVGWISWQRAGMTRGGKPIGRLRAAAESFGVLAVTAAVVAATVRFTPGGGA